MSTAQRQLHLGAFLFGVGHHIAAWRHPDVDPAAALRPQHYKNLARIAEAGLFDAIFSADTMGLPGAPAEALARNVPPHQFEPLELLTALAGVTERIGLVGTVSTTYLPPHHQSLSHRCLAAAVGNNLLRPVAPGKLHDIGIFAGLI